MANQLAEKVEIWIIGGPHDGLTFTLKACTLIDGHLLMMERNSHFWVADAPFSPAARVQRLRHLGRRDPRRGAHKAFRFQLV